MKPMLGKKLWQGTRLTLPVFDGKTFGTITIEYPSMEIVEIRIDLSTGKTIGGLFGLVYGARTVSIHVPKDIRDYMK